MLQLPAPDSWRDPAAQMPLPYEFWAGPAYSIVRSGYCRPLRRAKSETVQRRVAYACAGAPQCIVHKEKCTKEKLQERRSDYCNCSALLQFFMIMSCTASLTRVNSSP